MADVRFYEAIVVDGTPDASLPGHIEVKIPALFGNDDAVPVLIPPLYPGATYGGWQSVPQATGPDGDEIRVIVAHLGGMSFRWMGTSQVFSAIAGDPANRVGARSKDGRHSIFLDNNLGAFIACGSDSTPNTSSFITIDPADDTITFTTATGSSVQISEELIHLQNLNGETLQLDATNGVILMHADGVASLQLRTGDIASLSGSEVKISGGGIELGGGVIPPTHPYVLTLTWFAQWQAWVTAMDAFMLACSVAVVEPALGPAALAFQAAQPGGVFAGNIAASLAGGAPYLSTRIFGD